MNRLTLTGKASGVAALVAITWAGSSLADPTAVPPAPTFASEAPTVAASATTVSASAQTVAAAETDETSGAPPTAPNSTVQPILGEKTTYRAPNGPLVIGGAIVFFGSYVPAVVVAAVVDTSFDNNLYIPLVGPWLDMANRPQCGDGFLQPRCSAETGRKIVLGVNGVLQAAGLVSAALGLALSGRHTEIVTATADQPQKAHVSVLPSQMGRDGYGVAAFGDF